MSSGGGLHSLSTIIKRLEAATSRIEDIASHGFTSHVEHSGQASALQTGSAPTPAPPPPPAPPAPAPPAPAKAAVPAADPPSVTEFDSLVITGKLKPFLDLTRSFAAPAVIEQVTQLEKEFTDVRTLIKMATLCKKPAPQSFNTLLAPLQSGIENITKLKEANRKDRDWFTHLSVIAEGAPFAGWVQVETKPAAYVCEVRDSTQFWGNRVIKESGSKNPKHAEWVRAFVAVLEETRLYVSKYHSTGLVWNASGGDSSQYKTLSPPTTPSAPPARATPSSASSGGAAAVFAQINQGENVTKGLRKVDASQQNHKNPALRASNVAPETPSTTTKRPPARPMKPQSLQGKKPPKFALDGNKWAIEFQENESLTVEDGEINQQVNLYACKKTTVIIKGKVNAVTLVDCQSTSVLVESVISSVSVTHSPSFTIQITGAAPTITLDNTDSGQIYLSKSCLGVEITTAKCSSINVSLPVEGEEDGIFEEQAVPEMFKTVIKDGKLLTTVVEHTG